MSERLVFHSLPLTVPERKAEQLMGRRGNGGCREPGALGSLGAWELQADPAGPGTRSRAAEGNLCTVGPQRKPMR